MRSPVLANRDFTLLIVGRGVSSLGDYFGELALSFFVYVGTNSPVLLAITFVSFSVPRSVARLLGGVYVDRIDRKKLMITTEIVRGTIFGILSILSFFDKLSLFVIYPLLSVAGGLAALFEMTSDAFVPQIVEKDMLFRANSLMTAVLNMDSILGPALAGLAIFLIGVGSSMLIDSLSFYFLVFCLFLIRDVKVESKKREWMVEFKEGLSFFKKRAELLWLAITFSIINFALGAFWNIYLLVFSLNVINVGSVGWGILNTMSSAGIVLMAAILTKKGEIRQRRSAIVVSCFAIALFVATLALTRDIVSSSVVMFVLGMSVPTSAVIISAYYQRVVPKEQLGRVLGFRYLINYFSVPIGVVFGGIILNYVNVREAFILTSIVIVLACLIPILKRTISRIDRED
jgi:MFS family permease